MLDPFSFCAGQAPNAAVDASAFPPPALVLSLQVANVFLLLALVAIICCWTPDHATTCRYLVAVALADYGHIYATYRGVGPDYFWDVAGWNDMVWANVGVSLFLNVFRWLTVLGVFGWLKASAEGIATDKKCQ